MFSSLDRKRRVLRLASGIFGVRGWILGRPEENQSEPKDQTLVLAKFGVDTAYSGFQKCLGNRSPNAVSGRIVPYIFLKYYGVESSHIETLMYINHTFALNSIGTFGTINYSYSGRHPAHMKRSTRSKRAGGSVRIWDSLDPRIYSEWMVAGTATLDRSPCRP